jgi:long-subunit acyl-CoA synthetase (AMP-forming)
VFEKEQVAMLRELVVRFNLLLTHKKGDIANETIGNMFVTYSDRKCLATYQNGVYVYSTYEQIHNRILNFAAGLVKLQMIPNIKHLTSSALDTRTYVVICGKNSLEWFLTDYACVIKSLVSVTIHYTTSKEDIEHIMSAMKVSVVVCTSDLVPMFNAICANHPSVRGIITMDQESMEKAIVPLHTFKQVEKTGSSHKKYRNTVALNSTQDVLTLVYTSGSTGRPKGAMIPDVTWNNQIKNPMEPYRTSMVFAPLAHVV